MSAPKIYHLSQGLDKEPYWSFCYLLNQTEMPKVLELDPADVGTPLPANARDHIPSDARSYDFIIVGGTYPLSYIFIDSNDMDRRDSGMCTRIPAE